MLLFLPLSIVAPIGATELPQRHESQHIIIPAPIGAINLIAYTL